MVKKKQIKNSLAAFLMDIFFWTYLFLSFHSVILKKIILAERFSDFNWTYPLKALLLGFILSALLFFIKGFSLGKAILNVESLKTRFYKKPYFYFSLILILLTFVVGLFITQVSIHEFLSIKGLGGAKRIFTALLTPNFKIFEPALFAAIETIYMAFIATMFAIPVAFLLSFFAARNLMKVSKTGFIIYVIIRFFMNLIRAIEPLVWAIVFSVWVGIGPFAGMMALCLHSIAALSKLYSEQIENISVGPIEAIKATGAHPIQVVWYGVVPQIVMPFLSFTIYRWDINVRMATIIGLVGGGGIGTMIMQYQGLAKWNEVGLLVIVIASIVWMMDYISARVRESIG